MYSSPPIPAAITITTIIMGISGKLVPEAFAGVVVVDTGTTEVENDESAE